MLANGGWDLTLILLTWTIWRAPSNDSKWRMGFNSAFKGLKIWEFYLILNYRGKEEIVRLFWQFQIHISRRYLCCSFTRNGWVKFWYNIKPVATCHRADRVSWVQCTATSVCFQVIKVFTGKQILLKYTVIMTFVAAQYTNFEWTLF